jgi:hypothetical protein
MNKFLIVNFLASGLAGIMFTTACTAEAPSVAQQPQTQVQQVQTAPAADAAITADYQQEVLAAQAAQARKQQVTLGARVYKLLPDDRKGLPHQRFLIMLSNGTTVLIAHDIKLAPYIPLRQGDFVRIHGEYIWNTKGGVIHWTHHDPGGRHEGGWIDFNGQRYQ